MQSGNGVVGMAGLMVCMSLTAWARDAGPQHSLVYAAPDSHALRLTLRLPKDDGTALRPAVVLIHGGCWAFGTRHQLHWYARRLEEHGFVTAAISYRLMPAHGFPDCLHDCKAAVRWLRLHAAEYRVDPNRIAVLGNSAGGHLAGMVAATRPEDGFEGAEDPGASSAVQAAVVLYGVSDLSYFCRPSNLLHTGGITGAFVNAFAGQGRNDQEDAVKAASPTTYARPGMCPTLLIHGTRDHIVPYAQSEAFCDQLRRLGVATRLIAVPYGHAFDFFHPRARADVLAPILAFLDAHMGPGREEGTRP